MALYFISSKCGNLIFSGTIEFSKRVTTSADFEKVLNEHKRCVERERGIDTSGLVITALNPL